MAKADVTRLEACTRDCRAAREARAAAQQILDETEPDTRWDIQAWALPSPPGQIKLTLAGGPWGRVPPSFRRKWMLALADSALDEARLLAEQEQL